MAASSRWLARRTGRWGLQPTARSSRQTWAGWYRTPKTRSITTATRRVVQTSPVKPYASAPRARKAGSRARCSGASFGVGPGATRRRSAATPPARARLHHWLTAPSVTPSARAMARWLQPCCVSSQARSRRPSRRSAGRRIVSVVMLAGRRKLRASFTALTQRSVTPLPQGERRYPVRDFAR